MPKTEEELKALKARVEALEKDLKELSEDELEKVAGGFYIKPSLDLPPDFDGYLTTGITGQKSKPIDIECR